MTDIVIGAPVGRKAAFALDKFLANQVEIQRADPGCALVLATDEPDFVPELLKKLKLYHLRGEVISYRTERPQGSVHRMWSITAGREALRVYALSSGVEYLLYLDADMAFDPAVTDIMKSRIRGFDAAYSGYKLRWQGNWGFATGCVLLTRKALSLIRFHCYEFKGHGVSQDEVLDMDLFRTGARANKGLFLTIKHYQTDGKCLVMAPGRVSLFRRTANSLPVRYLLVRTSVLLKFNIEFALHLFFSRFFWEKNKR